MACRRTQELDSLGVSLPLKPNGIVNVAVRRNGSARLSNRLNPRECRPSRDRIAAGKPREAYARRLLPIQLAAAKQLLDERSDLTIHLGRSPNLTGDWLERCVAESSTPVVVWNGAQQALDHATVALAGMGTVTLEAALSGRPYVGMARVHPLTAWIGRKLIASRHFSLPNLVLDDGIFPECVQDECTPAIVAGSMGSILDSPGPYLVAIDELRQRVAGGVGPGPVLDFLLDGETRQVSGWT